MGCVPDYAEKQLGNCENGIEKHEFVLQCQNLQRLSRLHDYVQPFNLVLIGIAVPTLYSWEQTSQSLQFSPVIPSLLLVTSITSICCFILSTRATDVIRDHAEACSLSEAKGLLQIPMLTKISLCYPIFLCAVSVSCFMVGAIWLIYLTEDAKTFSYCSAVTAGIITVSVMNLVVLAFAGPKCN